MKDLNGYIEEFYVLGDICGTYYIGENGENSITDPSVAKRFKNYSEASDYYKQNADDYNDHLYPQEIRITIQII